MEKWKIDFFFFLSGKVENCKVKELFFMLETGKS